MRRGVGIVGTERVLAGGGGTRGPCHMSYWPLMRAVISVIAVAQSASVVSAIFSVGGGIDNGKVKPSKGCTLEQ